MNLAEVKSALGVANLELNKSTNADGTVNPEWFRMWNNETRVQISIHKDVVNAIQAILFIQDFLYIISIVVI